MTVFSAFDFTEMSCSVKGNIDGIFGDFNNRRNDVNREDFLREMDDILALEAGTLSADSEIRAQGEWGSLAALSLIAVVDGDYGVTLDGTDIESCRTFGDLMTLIGDRVRGH